MESRSATCRVCGRPREVGTRCKPCRAARQNSYRARNPEKARAIRRESAARHPETHLDWCAANRASVNAINVKCYRTNVAKRLLDNAQHRAIRAGVPCTITADDVQIPAFCPVLDIPLTIAAKGFQPNSPSIDRIIPALGYVPGNVAVISNRANLLKRDGTLAEFEALAAWLRKQAA